MKTSIAKKIGIVLVIIGLALPLCVYGYFKTIKWVPLDRPISIAPATLQETFRTDYKTRYSAAIGFDRHSIPGDKVLCLVGMNTGTCAPSDAVLESSWQLSRGKRLIQSGSYNQSNGGGGFTADNVYADFAYFDARRGEEYTLSVANMSSRAQVLNVANPRLLVEVSPASSGWALLLKAASQFFWIPLVLLGVFFIFLGSR